MITKKMLGGLTATALLIGSTFQVQAAERFISIGTGGVTGVYYAVGGSICRLVNKEYKGELRCNAESTAASVYNLNTIRAGEMDIGVAQSDTQYYALKGTDMFKAQGPDSKLRAMFSVEAEPLTVVARKDANIHSLEDLKGKRVNIGNPGSGQRATMEVIMDKKGWDKSDFSLASELKAAEMASALCDNKIDAMIYVVGHPNGAIKEATSSCESNLVNIQDPVIDQLVNDNSYYSSVEIPAGMYDGTPEATKTFGAVATMVTSTDVPEDVIYKVVKSVFENFSTFKRLHPAFAHLTKEQMVHDGLSAPLHPGAVKYYKEVGLL